MGEPLQNQVGKRFLGIMGRSVAYFVMGLFAFMTLAPIIWLIISSFKTTTEFRVNRVGLPHVWTTVNYPGAWTLGEFDKLIGNSFIYTIGATAGIIFFSILAGFAFAKIKSRATPLLYGSFVLGILLSIQSLMVPLFLEVSQLDRLLTELFRSLGILKSGNVNFFYDSRFGVLLIYIGSGSPDGDLPVHGVHPRHSVRPRRGCPHRRRRPISRSSDGSSCRCRCPSPRRSQSSTSRASGTSLL